MTINPLQTACIILLVVAAGVSGSIAETGKTATGIPREQGGWRRDPFQGGGVKKLQLVKASLPKMQPDAKPSKDVTLQGTMKIGTRYFALVNGRTVKTGDKFDGIVIEDVTRHGITIKDETGKRRFDVDRGELRKGEK